MDRIEDNVGRCDVCIFGISFSKGVAMSTLLCACGGKCSGSCSQEHLNRKRISKVLEDKPCQSAYEKPQKREYHQDRDEE